MESPETALTTIAEVAVAYVGFASIVAVIQSARSEEWQAEDRLIFRAMIEVSFATLLWCFLPAAAAVLELGERATWMVASALALATGAALLTRRMILVRRHLAGMPRAGTWFFLPMSVLSWVVLLANLLVWKAAGPYLIAVLISLAVASAMFLSLLARFFPLSGSRE
jgi:hypothetical protein